MPAPYDPATNAVRMPADLAAWLAREVPEPVLEPELRIVDPHHHFWRRPAGDYLPTDLVADFGGHAVAKTVFVECNAIDPPAGPEALRPVAETAFVVDAVQAFGQPGLAAGIVGRADLTLGDRVRPVLEAHIEAGAGRFRGIRLPLRWDASGIGMFGRPWPADLAADPAFRRGFAQLAPLGLSFDAWLFHPQLLGLVDLARAFPGTTVIVNHVGGPLGTGPYAGQRAEVFEIWRRGVAALAGCPNVLMKVGGLGMLYYGFAFHEPDRPPGSAALAAAWRPYVETCIEQFGPVRCMLESNFPVDKQSCSYRVLWNALKRLTRGCSADERAALFRGTAEAAYRI